MAKKLPDKPAEKIKVTCWEVCEVSGEGSIPGFEVHRKANDAQAAAVAHVEAMCFTRGRRDSEIKVKVSPVVPDPSQGATAEKVDYSLHRVFSVKCSFVTGIKEEKRK